MHALGALIVTLLTAASVEGAASCENETTTSDAIMKQGAFIDQLFVLVILSVFFGFFAVFIYI